MKPKSYTIPAGKFKATCLKIMDNVNTYHSHVIITKHGKPIAKLIPIDEAAEMQAFGCMKDTVAINGDIISPIDVEWNALK